MSAQCMVGRATVFQNKLPFHCPYIRGLLCAHLEGWTSPGSKEMHQRHSRLRLPTAASPVAFVACVTHWTCAHDGLMSPLSFGKGRFRVPRWMWRSTKAWRLAHEVGLNSELLAYILVWDLMPASRMDSILLPSPNTTAVGIH